MATLSGTAISDTYPLLLKIASNGLDGTLRVVQDGDATDSVLSLATDSALISGNGTKLYFYDADGGEHISADNSANLTIAAGTDINLTAGTDINIPANVGLTFGHASNQKIEGNGTDLAIDATGNINITSTVNQTDSIKIEENSGTDGTIKIYANTGSGADSINLLSDVGGITLSAGNTSEGVKVGTVTGAPVTIGHTTSETTVADNLTVTGNTTLSGNLTATTVNGQSFTNTLGGTGGVVRTFSPVSYTSSKGKLATAGDVEQYTGDNLTSTIIGTIHTSSHSASSAGPSIAITAPTQGMDIYLVTVTSTRKDVSSGSASSLFSHQGGAYIVTITSEANNRMTVATLGEDDLDGTLSTSSGNHFVTFTLSAIGAYGGAMRLNALLLMRGSM